MMFIQKVAPEVRVFSNTSPEKEEGRVEKETKHNGSKGAQTNVSWRILEHISPVCAAQDACEAWVEKTQDSSEADARVVMRFPIFLEGFPAEPGDVVVARNIWIQSAWSCHEQAQVETKKCENHDQREQQAQFRHNVDASPNEKRQQRHGRRAEGLAETWESHGRCRHGQGLHSTQALQD
eukprot:Skav219395  [mRNA]  locus=scaffold2133:286483:300200:- [translate_table: standard]